MDVAWGRQEISLARFERWGSLREEAREDGCESMAVGKKRNPPSILLEHAGACFQGPPVSPDEAAGRNWSSSEGVQRGSGQLGDIRAQSQLLPLCDGNIFKTA